MIRKYWTEQNILSSRMLPKILKYFKYSSQVLVKGNEIRLREFGTFKQKKSAARLGRNPRTGEDLQILGSTSVGFSISSALKVKVK